VRGWTVRPLFPQLPPAQTESGDACSVKDSERIPRPDLIRELNRFCVYQIEDPRQTLRDVPFPPELSAHLVRLDQDCAALSPGETYLGASRWPANDREEKDFLVQAGKPDTLITTAAELGVRLAFLDTQPTGVGLPTRQGNSPHGYTLAHLAHDLVCDGKGDQERCAAQITTRLALPLIKFDPKHPANNQIARTRGGYLGLQSDLAEAIRDEVDAWRTESPRQHLVLNLSMAWDGNLFGGLEQEQIRELPAGTQAVYRALQYAAGFDVLVLAAAGNQKHEPCANYGPLLPAAWEEEAPRDGTCSSSDAPLLYAVGGLQANGKYLDNARPGGMPRRAAYGETSIFAGSSVATAVASSIAAVVWNEFPKLPAREVMEILDTRVHNHELSTNADFWFRSGPQTALAAAPKVQRLSLCTALETACTRLGVTQCPVAAPCSFLEAGTATPHPEIRAEKGSCAPWLLPQPEQDPCPACIKPPEVQ
jgi:hypothetical protein